MSVLNLIHQIFIQDEFFQENLLWLTNIYWKTLVDLGLWNDGLKQEIMRANGSVQNIEGIPEDIQRTL